MAESSWGYLVNERKEVPQKAACRPCEPGRGRGARQALGGRRREVPRRQRGRARQAQGGGSPGGAQGAGPGF